MTLRPYTGISDGIAPRRRPGTEHFASATQYLTSGRLWNNGTYGVRYVTGSTRTLSVHSTGRAVDLDSSKMGDGVRIGCTLPELASWADFFAEKADHFGIELVIHYAAKPYGRSWRCDRGTWRNATAGALSGGGTTWADHLHIELAPAFADSPALIDAGWASALTGGSAPVPAPPPPKYPGRMLKIGSTGKSVELVQERLGIVVDGKFGTQTDFAVRAFQNAERLVVDGIVGPVTWAKLFNG